MTYVARVELTNWFRFRSAAVDLGPRAYAVEAEDERDPARSNWIGKSSFAEAVPFALYGWHRYQEGERAPGFEDRWITDGADEGGVALMLSNGYRIERTRERGRSTVMRFFHPSDSGRAISAAVQDAIDHVVGLGRDDFFSTAFVRQKLCAQLVTARPADRMSLIADWLDFSKLEAAGALLASRVTDRARERDRLAARVGDLRGRAAELEAEEHFGYRLGAVQELATPEAAASVVIAEAASRLRGVEAQLEARGRWDVEQQERARAAAARARLEGDLAAAKEYLSAMPAERPAPDASGAGAALALAKRRLAEASSLARGEFDGRCPVRPGFACPATAQLNDGCAAAQAAERDARSQYQRATVAAADAERAAKQLADEAAARRLKQGRAEALREQLARLGPETESQLSVSGEGPPPGSRAEVEEARRKLEALRTALALCRRSAAELAKLRAELADVEAKREAAELSLLHARAARLVVGRGGAQRRIAEAAVGAIARGANARLASIGVDLRVSLSWRREGAEPASACEACGAGYPRSAKVRACSTCGAERGKQQQDRLDVELSDRSGAAEDLAGLALQRAACAFLRRRRGAPWATLVLDEPFGALDEAHRGAVARGIAQSREEDGLEQVMVVAHDRGILDSLPGRILIRGRGEGSTVEVVE